MAKEIYFEVQEPLVKILSSLETVREGQVKINQLAKSRADFDNYCMLLDLPLILESFSDFPLKDGYLQNQLEHQKKMAAAPWADKEYSSWIGWFWLQAK